MSYVKQQGKSDCGVACLAMLCDVSYDKALKTIEFRRRGLFGGTTTKQLRVAALKLNYLTDSTPQHRLKVVRAPKEWAALPSPSLTDFWHTIPNNSLVKIKHNRLESGGWHWVVWKKNKVYDPSRGVFHPSRFGYKPFSYMQFITIEVTR